jgi:hypothetical protein
MGLFVRTIGLARATTKIGMANLVYNVKRLIFLRTRVAALPEIGATLPKYVADNSYPRSSATLQRCYARLPDQAVALIEPSSCPRRIR